MNKLDHPLINIIKDQKRGLPRGICSVCSAHEYVLEVVLQYALAKNQDVLIEATCNQVNQFGGYSGMRPLDFARLVFSLAHKVRFPLDRIFLGGDHLGPNPWRGEKSTEAMEKACALVREYALAGFSKFHLDTSMPLRDDATGKIEQLTPEIIVQRQIRLGQEVEKVYANNPVLNSMPPVYVIGTEVPAPGGKKAEVENEEISNALTLQRDINLSKEAFYAHNLQNAWERVIAVVVNIGIGFNNEQVFNYQRNKVQKIFQIIKNYPNLTIEAHSTDYQPANLLKQMVIDGVAILKVGPALTFAFREALFALAHIEKELFYTKPYQQSNLIEIIEEKMLEDSQYWQEYYQGAEQETRLKIKYSLLDRVRYYWNVLEIKKAVNLLIENLHQKKIPLTLLSQFMPLQYQRVKEGLIENTPRELINDSITRVLDHYYAAI